MNSYIVENANELLHQQENKFGHNTASFYPATPISAAAAAAAAAVAAATASTRASPNIAASYFPNPSAVFGSVTDDLFYRPGGGYYPHQQNAFAHPVVGGMENGNGRNGHQQLFQVPGHMAENSYPTVNDVVTNPCAYSGDHRAYPVSQSADTTSMLINDVINSCSSDGGARVGDQQYASHQLCQKNGKNHSKNSNLAKRTKQTPSPIQQPSGTDLGQSSVINMKTENGSSESPPSDTLGLGRDTSPKFCSESRAHSSSISPSEDDDEAEGDDKGRQSQQQSGNASATVTYPWMKRVHSANGKLGLHHGRHSRPRAGSRGSEYFYRNMPP